MGLRHPDRPRHWPVQALPIHTCQNLEVVFEELPQFLLSNNLNTIRWRSELDDLLVGELTRERGLGLANDGRRLGDLLEEDVALDEPGQPYRQLVLDELAGRDGEDLCEKRISRWEHTA